MFATEQPTILSIHTVILDFKSKVLHAFDTVWRNSRFGDVCRYDSEYDNYRGCITSDCESEMAGEGVDGLALAEGINEAAGGDSSDHPFNLENIRQISQNITNKFGNR